MKILKMYAALALCLALILSFAACSKKGDNGKNPGDSDTPAADTTVTTEGIVYKDGETLGGNGENGEKSDFVFTVTGGKLAVTDYTGADKKVSVPATFQGMAVAGIGELAFDGCENIEAVTLPEGIIYIDPQAFRYCKSLNEISLPASLTDIADDAFLYCAKMKTVKVAKDSQSFCTVDGVLFSKDEKVLEFFPNCVGGRDYPMPEKTEKIGGGAFRSSDRLEQITLNEGLVEIGADAFNSCMKLTKIVIPDTVTTIGDSAFWGCKGLTEIVLPSSLTKISDKMLYGCSAMSDITIPESVTAIGAEAFSNCKSIKTLSLPTGLTSIASGAFSYCSALETMTLPFILSNSIIER